MRISHHQHSWQEYYNEINPGDKSHDSNAYNYSLAKDEKSFSWADLSDGSWKLVNTKTMGKIEIQYYHKVEERQRGKYDDKNNFQVSSEEELNKKGLSSFYHTFIAYHPQEKLIVGSAQDEWGATLISVLYEYRGMGIGEYLVKLYRHYYPYKSSGGFTESGYKQFQKYYRHLVSQFLQNGVYSDMVKKGEITIEKVNQILKSAGNLPQFSKQHKSNLPNIYNGKGEYSLLIDDNFVIIFDTIIKDLWNTKELEDLNERFSSKFIKCFIYANQHREDEKYLSLFTVYATDEKFFKTGIDMLLSTGDGLSDYFLNKRFDDKSKQMIENLFNSSDYNVVQKDGERIITQKSAKYNMTHLKSLSKSWFKKNDQYNELENFIMEFAEGLAN